MMTSMKATTKALLTKDDEGDASAAAAAAVAVAEVHNNRDKEQNAKDDDLARALFAEAQRVAAAEPILAHLLQTTVLAASGDDSGGACPSTAAAWEEAIIRIVCHRLGFQNNNNDNNAVAPALATGICSSNADAWHAVFRRAFDPDNNDAITEYGYTIRNAIQADARAVLQRDPAMDTILQVVLFSKGFAALVAHRVAYRIIKRSDANNNNNKKHGGNGAGISQEYTALFLQSQCSAVFGVDIHPRAVLGPGLMLDHGTGIVVGETAVVGSGCTILHGVTLGGTGKDHGDRHPKIGNDVLIGAGTSILGNIRIGNQAKLGAGSVVLRDIPDGCTAVGAPAQIVGRVGPDEVPGSDIEETLSALRGSEIAVSTRRQQRQQRARRTPQRPAGTVSSAEPTLESETTTTTTTSSTTTSTTTGNTAISRSSSMSSLSTPGDVEDFDQSINDEQDEDGVNDAANDPVCPWRDLMRRGRESAPPGTLTLCQMRTWLAPATSNSPSTMPMAQLGACFLALDPVAAPMKGYVRAMCWRSNPHRQQEVVQALVEHVGLDAESARDRVDQAIDMAEKAVMTK